MNRLWVRLAVAYSFIFMVLLIVLRGLLEKDQSALNATLLAEVDYSAEEAQAVHLLIDSGKLEELFEKRDIEGFDTFTLSVLMAGLIAGILVTYWLTRPLKTLEEAAQAIGERSFPKRIAVKGPHEIRALGHSFNGMAEALQVAEIRRQQLLADVAHELRTPLTVLQNNLRAMLDDVYELDKAQLFTLYSQTRHLNHLVNDLHDLAQAEVNKLSLDKAEIDLIALLEQAVELFQPLAEENGITLHLDTPDRLPLVSGDRARLIQVLQNLLANGLRHANKRVDLRLWQAGERLCIEVVDDGEGISAEHLPHIFDRFYRIDRSRARQTGGTGLGLAITRAIIEAHSGTIAIASDGLGQGAIVSFELPVNAQNYAHLRLGKEAIRAITATKSPRRHDLDALRAVAMLLGIVLHLALAFAPVPWIVQDTQQHDAFSQLFMVIHGFRMPLFFLLSGFFTAMLWRKRGLRALLEHRLRRIFLPLLLGVVTIIPLMIGAIIVAFVMGAGDSPDMPKNAQADIWQVAAVGNTDAIASHLADGAEIDALDPVFGVAPLSWAALGGQLEAAEWLIAKGADVNAINKDGSTALHRAAFFGRTDLINLLIDKGAKINARNHKGRTPFDDTQVDLETTRFIAGLLAIEIDEEAVVQGRAESADLLRRSDAQTPKAAAPQPKKDEGEAFSFHHLWFLWHLCWLVVGFGLIALLIERFPLPKLPDWLVLSPARYLWLIPLTILPQMMMEGFGPDTSLELLPMAHVLGYYAIFFAFGALYYHYDDPDGRISREWWLALLLSQLVLFPLGLMFLFGGEGQTIIGAFLQAAFTWGMTFGAMGLFRKFFSGESERMRYLSDSSYWLYLAHLPLVIVGQAIVRPWQLPAIVKFTLLLVLITAFLLWTYEYLVRYRWLGTFLNGKRERRVLVAAVSGD